MFQINQMQTTTLQKNLQKNPQKNSSIIFCLMYSYYYSYLLLYSTKTVCTQKSERRVIFDSKYTINADCEKIVLHALGSRLQKHLCIYVCACVYVVIYCVGWKMSLELFMKFQNRTNFLFALVITWLQSFLLQLAFVIFVTHQNTNSQIELYITSTKFGEIGLKTCPLMTSWILDLLMWGMYTTSKFKGEIQMFCWFVLVWNSWC